MSIEELTTLLFHDPDSAVIFGMGFTAQCLIELSAITIHILKKLASK